MFLAQIYIYHVLTNVLLPGSASAMSAQRAVAAHDLFASGGWFYEILDVPASRLQRECLWCGQTEGTGLCAVWGFAGRPAA